VTQEIAGSIPAGHPTCKKEISMDFFDQFKGLFDRLHRKPEAEVLRQKRSEAAKRGAITRKANAAKKARAKAKKAKKKTSRKRAKK
jgi:hypothetical protein